MPETTESTETTFSLSNIPEDFSLVVRWVDDHFEAEVRRDDGVFAELIVPVGFDLRIN